MTRPARKSLQTVAIWAFAILVLQSAYALVVLWFARRNPENVGVFGDMFGALNALFSGWAFVGLIYTIHLQITDATEAREDQTRSLQLVQEQVRLLANDVHMQQRRDRVEAGPFFKIFHSGFSNSVLDLYLQNVGAPVICRSFRSTTPGGHVKEWSPSSLPADAQLHAPTHLESPDLRDITFEMEVRDRWGAVRIYEIQIDRRVTPPRLDFWEKEAAQ